MQFNCSVQPFKKLFYKLRRFTSYKGNLLTQTGVFKENKLFHVSLPNHQFSENVIFQVIGGGGEAKYLQTLAATDSFQCQQGRRRRRKSVYKYVKIFAHNQHGPPCKQWVIHSSLRRHQGEIRKQFKHKISKAAIIIQTCSSTLIPALS